MTDHEKTPALWRQLQATAQVLVAVENGQSGSAAVEAVPSELRSGVQALAFHAWRNMGRARAIRAQLVQKPPPLASDALLRLSLSLTWDASQALYDDFTLVNQAVEAAKNTLKTRPQAAFINACLRRFLRERDELITATNDRSEAQWNHPVWWIKRLKNEQPRQWQGLLASANRHPPMSLRINARKMNPADYLEKLKEARIDVALSEGILVQLAKPVPVGMLPGFSEGLVSVQDGAAQMASNLLLSNSTVTSTWRVLDACAAPGGKTAHLLESCDAEVLALEVDPTRAQRIHQTLDRLGLKATVRCADAATPDTWWDGNLFDRILLDAPCTASGIVRRHPDIRWLRRESDIAQLAQEQKKLLSALWPLLKPGGRLLYCTCSIFQAEGADQVKAFLDNNKDALLLPSPGHLLPGNMQSGPQLSDNRSGDNDGFFYALFEKISF